MKKQKLGRPFLAPEERKVNVGFKTKPDKKREIEEKANTLFGGNMSKYINYKLFSDEKKITLTPNSTTTSDRTEFYALVRELNKIGNNLNQLTRKAHMGHFINEELEKTLIELLTKKESIFSKLVEILNANVPNKK